MHRCNRIKINTKLISPSFYLTGNVLSSHLKNKQKTNYNLRIYNNVIILQHSFSNYVNCRLRILLTYLFNC